MISSLLAWSHSSWSLLASLVLDLWASAWSARSLLWVLSAFLQFMNVFHKNLLVSEHVTSFRHRLRYMWWPIFLDSQYLLSSWRILILLIQATFSAIQALAVPFGLPHPYACLSCRLRCFSNNKLGEWTSTGFQMISPSLINFQICWWELALEISLVSLGSKPTFFLPQKRTLQPSLFWSLSNTHVCMWSQK